MFIECPLTGREAVRVNLRIIGDKKGERQIFGRDLDLANQLGLMNQLLKGIEDEIIEKIFNPFFTTKNEGIGMGLAISSRLVEENGGRLEVNSEIGKGSSFSLYLPI